jgi:ribosome modulation factor
MIDLDTACVVEGQMAALQGRAVSVCPYSDEAKQVSWVLGWIQVRDRAGRGVPRCGHGPGEVLEQRR